MEWMTRQENGSCRAKGIPGAQTQPRSWETRTGFPRHGPNLGNEIAVSKNLSCTDLAEFLRPSKTPPTATSALLLLTARGLPGKTRSLSTPRAGRVAADFAGGPSIIWEGVGTESSFMPMGSTLAPDTWRMVTFLLVSLI